MTAQAKPHARFGEEIAAMQDALLDPGRDIAAARQQFMREGPRPRPFVRRPTWVAAAAAGLVLVASMGVVLWPKPSLTFWVEGVNAQAEIGVPIAAPAPHDAVLHFSDGSTFVLRPHARARTTSLRAEGASILLERGAGIATVVPRRDARWEFRAGEFRVLVTGTKFDLAWRPEDRTLSVRMHEGSIVVTGCQLEEGVGVSAGQALEVRCMHDEPDVTLRPLTKVGAILSFDPEGTADELDAGRLLDAPRDAQKDAAETAEGPERERVAKANSVAKTKNDLGAPLQAPDAGSTTPSWQDLAASGQYRGAYQAAASLGFGAQCNQVGAEELLVLADAATYAGQRGHAAMALTAARRRFPSSHAAATAAFMLGRIASDHRHDHGEARRWFNVYLSEQPSGSLAREAMGRLMEVERQSGNSDAARALARRYLRRHPNGPHARFAKSLLTNE